jgi:hypothetical protein
MINYSHLYSWRNLCEYLYARPYKFAQPHQIKRDCKCLPSLYAKDRLHRQFLFDNYLIQFIHWCPHPDEMHGPRGRRGKYEYDWGWQLCREWEDKIDFLEQVVLFDREPTTKTWEPGLRLRMQVRAERQARLELEQKLKQQKENDRKAEAARLNICWRCLEPISFLMVDCINCGAIQC